MQEQEISGSPLLNVQTFLQTFNDASRLFIDTKDFATSYALSDGTHPQSSATLQGKLSPFTTT